MPIYEYRCEQGHTFEVMQRMSEDPVTTCATCGSSVQRIFHPVAVHFKGSGFYNTDYGKKRTGASSSDSGSSAGDSDSSPSSKTESPKKTESSSPSKSD